MVVDLPFMSYQASDNDGMRAAGHLMKSGGAQSVKLEGGRTSPRSSHAWWARAFL